MAQFTVKDVDPKVKARWVKVAQLLGVSPSEWARSVLTEAAASVQLPPPKWMIAAGFSRRLMDVLLGEGITRQQELLAAWEARTEAQWRALPNAGLAVYQELANHFDQPGVSHGG